MAEPLIEKLRQSIDAKYPDDFMTLDDIAKYVKGSKTTVYNWTRRTDSKRRLRRLKAGPDLVIPKLAFVEWLAREIEDPGEE